MKHTKGPWRVLIWSRHVRDHREELFQVIDAHGNEQYKGRHLDNANLIAAAPEMLKALENAQESINQALGLYKNKLSEDLRNELLHIYTSFIPAIKKAKGE